MHSRSEKYRTAPSEYSAMAICGRSGIEWVSGRGRESGRAKGNGRCHPRGNSVGVVRRKAGTRRS